MNNVDLNINNYSFQDLLDLFNLQSNFNIQDLKNTKKIVLQTHPDKSKLPKEYFLFYSKAYKMLYHVYEFRSKSKKDFNDNYDNLIDDNDNSNKLLIKDMNNKEKFHVWFNRLFDKYYDKQDNGHGNWLSSKTTDELPSFNNTQQINSYIEEKKKNLSKDHALIKQNYELNIPCVGEEIYNSEKEIYSNNDIFSKFQYEDVKIAHNETLIPVSEDILETKEKYNSLNDIKNKRSSVNYKVMSKNDANKYLYEKNSNETNIASHKAFELIKEQEKNMDKNNLFWSELKMLQIKK